jgi:hypothetical protein
VGTCREDSTGNSCNVSVETLAHNQGQCGDYGEDSRESARFQSLPGAVYSVINSMPTQMSYERVALPSSLLEKVDFLRLFPPYFAMLRASFQT